MQSTPAAGSLHSCPAPSQSRLDRLPSFPRLAGSADHYEPSTRTYDDRRPPARHLFYGSSATSNQRLIIQRGNCATSLYDRATRHAAAASTKRHFLPRMCRGVGGWLGGLMTCSGKTSRTLADCVGGRSACRATDRWHWRRTCPPHYVSHLVVANHQNTSSCRQPSTSLWFC